MGRQHDGSERLGAPQPPSWVAMTAAPPGHHHVEHPARVAGRDQAVNSAPNTGERPRTRTRRPVRRQANTGSPRTLAGCVAPRGWRNSDLGRTGSAGSGGVQRLPALQCLPPLRCPCTTSPLQTHSGQDAPLCGAARSAPRACARPLRRLVPRHRPTILGTHLPLRRRVGGLRGDDADRSMSTPSSSAIITA
jgi:hypothetical protein